MDTKTSNFPKMLQHLHKWWRFILWHKITELWDLEAGEHPQFLDEDLECPNVKWDWPEVLKLKSGFLGVQSNTLSTMWCLLEHFSMLNSYLKNGVPLSNVMWKPSLSEALHGDSTHPESKPYPPSSCTPSTFSQGMGQPSLSPGAARTQLLSWFFY